MSVNQYEFAAQNYADIVDPVLLAGKRAQMVRLARSRALSRLVAEFQERYEELLAEEKADMEREFERRIEATRRKAERERGAA